mmetsp:Transcript_21701/g.56534  ORF Transcript_21701/g.56534 Transcript_21701/m.56534 type:complete len:214 (-) Transcript_21701:753-1394(-)
MGSTAAAIGALCRMHTGTAWSSACTGSTQAGSHRANPAHITSSMQRPQSRWLPMRPPGAWPTPMPCWSVSSLQLRRCRNSPGCGAASNRSAAGIAPAWYWRWWMTMRTTPLLSPPPLPPPGRHIPHPHALLPYFSHTPPHACPRLSETLLRRWRLLTRRLCWTHTRRARRARAFTSTRPPRPHSWPQGCSAQPPASTCQAVCARSWRVWLTCC